MGKHKNILFLDEIPNDSPLLASAYAACDTFVLPSQFETPGIAALEAGLAGAKVVITPYGGTTDYFNEYAAYVNPFSVASIKKEIELSLNRAKTDELKNHIEANFLWEKIVQDTLDVYNQVLSARS